MPGLEYRLGWGVKASSTNWSHGLLFNSVACCKCCTDESASEADSSNTIEWYASESSSESHSKDITWHSHHHKPRKPKECPVCGKRVTHLDRHKQIHTREKLYSCRRCKQGFIRRDHMECHELTHTGSRKSYYSCDKCWKNFMYKHSLRSHMTTVHGRK